MGFEDMLVNFLLEPEDMMDLCNAIGEYRFQLTKLIVDNLHPDIILPTMTGVPSSPCSSVRTHRENLSNHSMKDPINI